MRQLPKYYSDVTQQIPARSKRRGQVQWRLIWTVFIGLMEIALLCAILFGILWAVWNVQIAR